MPCDIQRVVCRLLGIPIANWFEFEHILSIKNRNSSLFIDKMITSRAFMKNVWYMKKLFRAV